MVTLKKLNAANANWQPGELPTKLTINTASEGWIQKNNMIDLIKYPILTEKSYLALSKNQQYTFDVDLRLNKTQIKKLFQICFNVNITAVNTHIPPRKSLRVGATQGYRARYKRAILTLKKGQSLNFALL